MTTKGGYKLTPALQKAIVNTVKKGNYLSTAAQAVGVSKKQINRWIHWGNGDLPDKEPIEPYISFAKAIQQAQAEAEITLVKDIVDDKDWRAKSWVLERGPSRERFQQNVTVNAQFAPAASLLDSIRNRSIEPEEELEPLELPKQIEIKARQIKEESNARNNEKGNEKTKEKSNA
jgi:murein DD-endopeptidase MepM/ murein hydrolase activator NlpD